MAQQAAVEDAAGDSQWFQPGVKVPVQLQSLADETRCPICWGRIKSARVSMVCLHRYCASCIEQLLRTEMNSKQEGRECPVCRAHLHSRRATKPDPKFDIIIQALYGDAAKYDEEEDRLLAHENQTFIKEQQRNMEELKARLDEGRKNYKPTKGPKSKAGATQYPPPLSSQPADEPGPSSRRAQATGEEPAGRGKSRGTASQRASSSQREREELEIKKVKGPEEESQEARQKAEALLTHAANAASMELQAQAVLVRLQARDPSQGLTPLVCPFMLCPPHITAHTLRTLLSQRLRTSAGRPVAFSSLQLHLPAELQRPGWATGHWPEPLPLELSLERLQRQLANPMNDLVLQYSLVTR